MQNVSKTKNLKVYSDAIDNRARAQEASTSADG